MSSELVVIAPKTLAEAKDLASTLAGARTIPEALQKSPADVLAILMAGAELGLAPMQSIRALVLIKGKPTLSADAMGALVKSRSDVCEWLVLRHSDGARATYETKRRGDPASTTMSFTLDEAKQAGLNGDPSWRKFTAAMLRARALSAICRAVYPDLLLGVYDPDEIAPERDVTPPRQVTSTGITPQTEAESIAALSASIAQIAEGRPTPPVATARPRLLRVESPLRAELLAAIAASQDEAALNAMVARVAEAKSTLLPADYSHVRSEWGRRRDELRQRVEIDPLEAETAGPDVVTP